jgi:hypothetical protein
MTFSNYNANLITDIHPTLAAVQALIVSHSENAA